MFVSHNSRDFTLHWGSKSYNVVYLALLFHFAWRSQCKLCFVQVDQTYQLWHTRYSLPPYCPYLAISNILSNNIINTTYNRWCFQKELFAASGRWIRQINSAFHSVTSSSERLQTWLGSRMSPSPWSMVKLAITKRCLQQREAEQHSVWAIKRNRNRTRIIWG
jgi:hypothetical protein